MGFVRVCKFFENLLISAESLTVVLKVTETYDCFTVRNIVLSSED
jgi:hypothetical protein